jgi:hypothetical protein
MRVQSGMVPNVLRSMRSFSPSTLTSTSAAGVWGAGQLGHDRLASLAENPAAVFQRHWSRRHGEGLVFDDQRDSHICDRAIGLPLLWGFWPMATAVGRRMHAPTKKWFALRDLSKSAQRALRGFSS